MCRSSGHHHQGDEDDQDDRPHPTAERGKQGERPHEAPSQVVGEAAIPVVAELPLIQAKQQRDAEIDRDNDVFLFHGLTFRLRDD